MKDNTADNTEDQSYAKTSPHRSVQIGVMSNHVDCWLGQA
jgi:hypothetical protein